MTLAQYQANLQGLVKSIYYGGLNNEVLMNPDLGAKLTSDSWGGPDQTVGGQIITGYYDAGCASYDLLTRNASGLGLSEMLHVFAAGNITTLVPSAAPMTVAAPGVAKNVLTVGATENVRANGVQACAGPEANNADNVAFFSLRGPTLDGRHKPDIMAPGVHVQGLASQDPGYDGTEVCTKYYPITNPQQTLYTWSSGTSHSTPAVAGGVSLIYENYPNLLSYEVPGAFFPNPLAPSPAMLKALVINSARYLGSGNYASDNLPSDNFGMGEMDLGTAFDGTPRVLVDQTRTFF